METLSFDTNTDGLYDDHEVDQMDCVTGISHDFANYFHTFTLIMDTQRREYGRTNRNLAEMFRAENWELLTYSEKFPGARQRCGCSGDKICRIEELDAIIIWIRGSMQKCLSDAGFEPSLEGFAFAYYRAIKLIYGDCLHRCRNLTDNDRPILLAADARPFGEFFQE